MNLLGNSRSGGYVFVLFVCSSLQALPHTAKARAGARDNHSTIKHHIPLRDNNPSQSHSFGISFLRSRHNDRTRSGACCCSKVMSSDFQAAHQTRISSESHHIFTSLHLLTSQHHFQLPPLSGPHSPWKALHRSKGWGW